MRKMSFTQPIKVFAFLKAASRTQRPVVGAMAQLRWGAGHQVADLLLLHGSGPPQAVDAGESPTIRGRCLGANEPGDGVGGFGEFFFGCWPVGLSGADDAVAHMVIE